VAFVYRNRSHAPYFLNRKRTKSGGWLYFFAADRPARGPNQIPEGYEVYENAGGQVFLRRKDAVWILPEEVERVDRILRELDVPGNFVPKTHGKKNITVYEYEAGGVGFRAGTQAAHERLIEAHLAWGTPMALLRFRLHDRKLRVFVAERYCFRGSIDDWIKLSPPGPLEPMVRKFAPHLGRESFYELGSW
jgi:hypothetical protein